MLAGKYNSALLVSAGLLTLAVSYAIYTHGRSIWIQICQKMVGQQSVADVLARIGPASREHWKDLYIRAGLSYPSSDLAFLAVRDSAMLEV